MFACPSPPPLRAPTADRPRYAIRLRVHPGLALVDGDVVVAFTPNRTAKRIVFRLWPNGPHTGAHLDVGRATVDGKRVAATRPAPTTLVLRQTVRADSTVTIRLPWRLHVLRRADRIGRWAGGLRLGSFFPILPWDPRRGWITEPPAQILGESSTSPTADFDVTVRTPRGYRAFASGTPFAPGRWHAHAVRDFAVAVGRFVTLSATTHAPRRVTVAVAADPRTQVARDVLSLATRSLVKLSQRYGPYPWRTYTLVVAPDLANVGIEYPTVVFVGPGNFITTVVQHETAHQWFYSLVGNDQERDPWLDEALATWSQSRLAGRLPGAGAVRSDESAMRHVGAPISFFAHRQADYFREVYGGGLDALASLGSPSGVDCALRLYVARNGYGIAQPRDLLAELDRVIPGAAERLRRFGIHR